jgi:hypothetical protein
MTVLAFAAGVLLGRWWRWELNRTAMWRQIDDLIERNLR